MPFDGPPQQPLSCSAGSLILAAAIALSAASPPAARAGEAFTYKTPQGVSFTVTAEGLSSITVGDTQVAKGSWHAANMTQLREPSAPPAHFVLKDNTMEVIEPGSRVRVRHTGPNATATFDYAFEGEDVRIKARVENFTDKAVKATGFAGLTFLFDSAPVEQSVDARPAIEPVLGHRRQLVIELLSQEFGRLGRQEKRPVIDAGHDPRLDRAGHAGGSEDPPRTIHSAAFRSISARF